jgi:hypothetical protein
MDRAEVMQSPAYLAMTPSGKRVLHIIEGMTSRNGGGPNLRGLETSGRSDFRAGQHRSEQGPGWLTGGQRLCPGTYRWRAARGGPVSCSPALAGRCSASNGLDADRMTRPGRRAVVCRCRWRARSDARHLIKVKVQSPPLALLHEDGGGMRGTRLADQRINSAFGGIRHAPIGAPERTHRPNSAEFLPPIGPASPHRPICQQRGTSPRSFPSRSCRHQRLRDAAPTSVCRRALAGFRDRVRRLLPRCFGLLTALRAAAERATEAR